MMNTLEIKDLCKTYGDFSLDHIDLTLPSGCIMGLIGENGAGKSTTIKLILNMIRRDEGSIRIFGKDNREDLRLTKEDIGVVLDEVGIPECLNTERVGRIMEKAYRNWDQEAYRRYLSRLAVPGTKKFKDFSRGMKMKLGIAIALSHQAKLLLLDEATSGLDPVVRDDVMDLIMEFTRQEDHSVLISSHIVSDLEKICDYIAFLHRGKLLLCEEKDLLKERYGILHCGAQDLQKIRPEAVIGKKESAYGVEVLVDRRLISDTFELCPIDIEQLFIFMVKEGN